MNSSWKQAIYHVLAPGRAWVVPTVRIIQKRGSCQNETSALAASSLTPRRLQPIALFDHQTATSTEEIGPVRVLDQQKILRLECASLRGRCLALFVYSRTPFWPETVLFLFQTGSGHCYQFFMRNSIYRPRKK